MGLKVAMVTPYGVRCGVASYSRSLANALAQLGCEVYIVRWPRFGVRTWELIQGCVIDKIPMSVDLIHVQMEYGYFTPNLELGFYSSLRQLGKPVVTTMHVAGDPSRDSIIAQASSKVIVHNKWCAKLFGHKGKTVIIPHGCDPRECPPREECKKALGIDPKIPIVGYLGFISPAKGLEILIAAMTKVEAGLLIGGGWFIGEETDYINRLKEWSLKLLPGKCMWLGYVPDENMPIAYGAMDLVVYPSRWMSESGALLTALSHGKAVIARRLPPTREKERLGALATFSSTEDLVREVRELLKDESLRRRLEEGARKYAERNSWTEVADKHLSLYKRVLSRS
mgnify:CR=1 FL=1